MFNLKSLKSYVGISNWNAFRGTTLIHKEGTIGGARGVFVKKLKGIKNELTYISYWWFNSKPFKGTAKILRWRPF